MPPLPGYFGAFFFDNVRTVKIFVTLSKGLKIFYIIKYEMFEVLWFKSDVFGYQIDKRGITMINFDFKVDQIKHTLVSINTPLYMPVRVIIKKIN